MIGRREWIAGAIAASAAKAQLQPRQASAPAEDGSVTVLTSTTGVFTPPRGRSFLKFSFDFPEAAVAFQGFQFAFRVFTYENVYTPDAKRLRVQRTSEGLDLQCAQLLWAGGQQVSEGEFHARIAKQGNAIEASAQAVMARRVKSICVIVRGVPRGRISGGGGAFQDHHDDEVLLGYPFSAGDLNYAASLTTPLIVIERSQSDYLFISGLDDRVRATRYYFQPGERDYRVELVTEGEGWLDSKRIQSALWRIGRAPSLEAASRPHFEHVEKVYSIPNWETRVDAPKWLHEISLVMALHGMHFTGYVFNSFAKMLATLEWVARHIEPRRVLVFLPAWDGRYYWDYPTYRVSEILGGDMGLRRLIDRGHELGFWFMPMFGTNAANRELPGYKVIADAATEKIDGDRMDLNWVDWDNDRHEEGWQSYMNLGVESWCKWLGDRISKVIDRYKVDAYFLDIAGGWTNNPKADMHAGTKRLIENMRAKHPHVMVAGEMHYDALLSCIPLFQVFAPVAYPQASQKYVRNYYHLSHGAPGRGSTGVHEAGFVKWDDSNLSMPNPLVIPTLTVVDDTFDRYREQMLRVIRAASKWTGA